MKDNTSLVDDLQKDILTAQIIAEGQATGELVILNGKKRSVCVGRTAPVKINTNIGISDTSSSLDLERSKLHFLSTSTFRPDLIMDHTIIQDHRDFWYEMVEQFDGPVGTLPHYTCYSAKNGIDSSELLERIEEMLVGGVAFMTLHPTADRDIYEIASRSRKVPVTSRGGGLLLRDAIKKGKNTNVMRAVIDDIAALFRKFGATISVGTTFRPANIFDALDEVHVMETERQIEMVHFLRKAGVSVIMEGVGHVPMDRISEYSDLIRPSGCPFMPLGPMTTESAIGFDHIANAIGGATMAFLGGAHILNSITREEHTGGVPTFESCVEGVKSARVAAHSVNITRFEKIKHFDRLTIEKRAESVSCVVSGGLFGEEVNQDKKGCTRCSFECPLILAPTVPMA